MKEVKCFETDDV